MPGRVFYPSVFNPPGQFGTTNTTQGGECFFPPTTRRRVPQQPQGEVLVPGAFTTTNTQLGGECLYPAGTRHLNPRQPQGETLPPGRFTTTNTALGGEVFAPSTTRRTHPQQPQGEVLPPGAFTTTVIVSTTIGWDILPPRIVRSAAQRPLQELGSILVPGVVPPSPPPPPPPLPYPHVIQMLNFVISQSYDALLAVGDDDNANASEDDGIPWLDDNSTANGPGNTMGPNLPNGATTGTPGPTRPTTPPGKTRRVRPGGSGVGRTRRVPAPVIILTITADDQSKNQGTVFTWDGDEFTDDGLQ